MYLKLVHMMCSEECIAIHGNKICFTNLLFICLYYHQYILYNNVNWDTNTTPMMFGFV